MPARVNDEATFLIRDLAVGEVLRGARVPRIVRDRRLPVVVAERDVIEPVGEDRAVQLVLGHGREPLVRDHGREPVGHKDVLIFVFDNPEEKKIFKTTRYNLHFFTNFLCRHFAD